MYTKREIIPALIALILVAGCQSQLTEPVAQFDETKFFVGQTQPVDLASLSADEVKNLHRSLADAGEAARRVMQSASDWREADRELRSLLTDAPEASRQFTAGRFLESTLLPARASNARTEAIDFYTRILIDGQNPDASIILPALTELEGVWAEDELRSARKATRHHAEKYLANNSDHASRAGIDHDAAHDAQVVRIYRIKQAIES
jgi:hypothetical protein